MSKVKVFAMYLPQYHETEVNNKFWGKGFTDWVSVKKATPLFAGHEQPQVPMNNNYYDLSKVESIKWQAEIAKKYGVDGWGIYHYWFNSNDRTLTKPAEILLENKDIDMPFFFAWDNASWKRTWSKIQGNDWAPNADEKVERKGPEVLIEYRVGTEKDWRIHFDYLLPYFKDSRYVKHDNRILFLIYNYSDEIQKMAEYWDKLAKENGFAGMECVFSYNPMHGIPKTAYKFRYEPLYSGWGGFWDRAKRLVFRNAVQTDIKLFSYSNVWKKLIRNAKNCHDDRMYYGAFVNYDDSPRRGKKGKAIIGETPDLFEKYLNQLLNVCVNKKKPFIFLTAWNEWGEGAHLEPDQIHQFAYLQALKRAKCGESK